MTSPTPDLSDESAVQTPDPQETGTLYPHLNAWVEEWLVHVYNRAPGGGRNWCHQWWMHVEAVYRLDALWRSWEYSRVNDGPMGAATWLVNFADPIMTVLTQPDGCFKGCKDGQHRAFELNPDEKLPTDSQPYSLQHDRE